MASRLIEWVKRKVLGHVLKRKPDFVIGDPAEPYMLRWWLIPRNRYFNIYVHRFLRSDYDRALHDHPWANASLVLEGRYTEHLTGGVSRVLEAGAFKFRPSGKFSHRVELHDGPCWTMFFTGPVYRTWGFHCKEGWKPYREVVTYSPTGSSEFKNCE